MACYLDSSALVKLYAPEPGSQWLKSLLELGADNSIYITQIGAVEVAAGLGRKVRTGELAQNEYEAALELFLRDIKDEAYNLLAIDSASINWAIELTRRHPLRGYDAVHLAAALRLNQVLTQNELEPVPFIAADRLLCEAAAKEGLVVENPDEHESPKR